MMIKEEPRDYEDPQSSYHILSDYQLKLLVDRSKVKKPPTVEECIALEADLGLSAPEIANWLKIITFVWRELTKKDSSQEEVILETKPIHVASTSSRKNTRTTAAQKDALLRVYSREKRITKEASQRLGESIGLPEKFVTEWFKARRRRENRELGAMEPSPRAAGPMEACDQQPQTAEFHGIPQLANQPSYSWDVHMVPIQPLAGQFRVPIKKKPMEEYSWGQDPQFGYPHVHPPLGFPAPHYTGYSWPQFHI
uniref:Homeobox domain-containing protein n=2 Tax=Caenorhabditis tropicalis TaxID=1561998 RepID=A0A1I7T698_9PELO